MGSWNEVCCITRLPVRRGDKCVMIDFENKPNTEEKFYQLDNLIPKRIIKDIYNDYGSVECLSDKIQAKEREQELWRIFILQSAWDEICKLYPRQLNAFEYKAKVIVKDDIHFTAITHEDEKLHKLIKVLRGAKEYTAEYLSIIQFMDVSGITFDSWWAGGSQDIDLTGHKDRIQITQKCLDSIVNEYEEENFYDEGESPYDERDVFCFDNNIPRGWWSKDFAITKGWQYCTADGIINPKNEK